VPPHAPLFVVFINLDVDVFLFKSLQFVFRLQKEPS